MYDSTTNLSANLDQEAPSFSRIGPVPASRQIKSSNGPRTGPISKLQNRVLGTAEQQPPYGNNLVSSLGTLSNGSQHRVSDGVPR